MNETDQTNCELLGIQKCIIIVYNMSRLPVAIQVYDEAENVTKATTDEEILAELRSMHGTITNCEVPIEMGNGKVYNNTLGSRIVKLLTVKL